MSAKIGVGGGNARGPFVWCCRLLWANANAMQRITALSFLALLFVTASIAASGALPVTTGTLLEEMADLGRLARWPEPAYQTFQFSSYDRRSATSESPGWFSNADGFGHEPIPGFLKVLREPRDGKPGLYLVAEVSGPGAIVRGWSAGMDGVLRVVLDPPEDDSTAMQTTPVWEGAAYDFLARRSVHYFKSAGLELDAGDAFVQQDADYLPMPFARGLRVIWEGKLDELHFYHLQIRRYPPGTCVRTFDAKKDLALFASEVRAAVVGLTQPNPGQPGESTPLAGTLESGGSWTWTSEGRGPGAVRHLRLRLHADTPEEALRRCLLRVFFDGSQRPQVEAPVGDFFASGPGVNPYSSLPIDVAPDGNMTCRFVMPFQKSAKLEILNFTKSPVLLEGSVQIAPWQWDDRSLYFHAKWRADHDLLAGAGAIDLPYTVAIGKGVFAGCAAMIMNPSGVPTAGGNWWGEGDEKFLVDGETTPSTFGTGSEDYFNYSWSRPDLFDHPFCGQPLDSGPDTAGYVSNHRFQVLDAIPFEQSLAALMELWAHRRTPGLSYARIAYIYARPGMVDDHRGLMPSDLKIPVLPKREPVAAGGATGAKIHLAERLRPEATAGSVELVPFPLATQLQVVQWRAEQGGKLKLSLPIEKEGRFAIHLVAVHQPAGATVRARVDGKALLPDGESGTVALKSAHASRVLNVNFRPVELKAGMRELILECVEAGVVGLDYIWVKSH